MKLPPWTHTMLSDLGNCMWKGYRARIKKDLPKEEKSQEQNLGIHVHKAFETAINQRKVETLPEMYRHLAAPMIAMGALAEVKMGCNDDGSGADFWGSPWGRGVADVLIIDRRQSLAVLFDWKTGKVREDDRELRAQSYLVKANYDVEHVQGAYVWLVENRMGTMYDLSDTTRWENGTRALLAKTQEAVDSGVIPKQPNPLCNWCPVKDCEYWETWTKRG